MKAQKAKIATDAERAAAATAAAAIGVSLIDPSTAGEGVTARVLLSRPRRGVWLKLWPNLPGLMLNVGARTYTHDLLPGWEYSVSEMRTEMIEDLETLAATGQRPKVATR